MSTASNHPLSDHGPERSTARLPLAASDEALVPTRAHADDAGLDLRSAIDVELAPGERALVPTGVSIALPPGTVGLVCPRSGMAARHGITIVNAPGIVDAGYRGELKVALLNTDTSEAFTVRHGDRIAQLVIVPILVPEVHRVTTLDASARGERGFGSSGGFHSSTPEKN